MRTSPPPLPFAGDCPSISPWHRLASQAGTLPAGGSFCSVKRNQNPLRAFPPKDLPGVRGWACVKSRFGPSPLLWLLVLPPHQATLGGWPYGWVVSISGPTLEKRRSRRRKPGHRPLGTAAYQDKALAVEGSTSRGVGGNHRTESHLCDMNQSRAEKRKVHAPPSTAGWIPQGGGRPRLWRFFPRFLIGEKSGPAERPWKGAGFCRGNWRSKFFFLRKRRKHTASSFSYSSMAMSTPLTCTPSWARIKMYFTPSMTRVDTRSLCSAGRRTVTSAAATSTCLG